MTEADILAMTYEDTVTVYRAFKKVLDSGESVFKSGREGKMIYLDEPCALSTHSGGQVAQSAAAAGAETTFCLFTRPEIDIQPNDYLVILHLKKTLEAVAGFSDRQNSHNNIPIKLELNPL